MDTFLGLDISLTSTGYTVVKGGVSIREGSIKTSTDEDWVERINKIVGTIGQLIDEFHPTLVLIENYSYGSTFGREVLGEIHGVVMYYLNKREVPFDKVPPTVAKLFGCGRGQAPKCPPDRAKSTWKKTWVIETVNEIYGTQYRLADNDICDSFIIALLAEMVHKVRNNAIDVKELKPHHKKALVELVNPKQKTKKNSRRKK
jgi:Holliday junction resolvasome RuvABC endonuclease subunit